MIMRIAVFLVFGSIVGGRVASVLGVAGSVETGRFASVLGVARRRHAGA
jgi:hypothetical protein